MDEYRDRTTGDLKTKAQLKKENPNMSLPKVWNEFTFDALNVDPVLPQEEPTLDPSLYQMVIRNGVEQNSSGNWLQSWQVVDMFEDNDQGTKSEQETAYQEKLDNQAALNNRQYRDMLIAETDWWASSDLTMTAEQTAYRQALRDITSHANWPHLDEDDWPIKP